MLVTMNRDEARSRAAESAPRLRAGGPTAPDWLAPEDGAAGGTWIGANDRGVIACLLNRYPASEKPKPARKGAPSRGRIVAEALAQGGPEQTFDWIESRFDPAPYSSFALMVLSEGQSQSYEWTGGDRLQAEPLILGTPISRVANSKTPSRRLAFPGGDWAMRTSSSWRTDEVEAWRAEAFDQWLADGARFDGQIPSFNLLQPKGRAEWSPLMSRELACTRSITQVFADFASGTIEMRHWPKPASKKLGKPSVVRLEIATGRLARLRGPLSFK